MSQGKFKNIAVCFLFPSSDGLASSVWVPLAITIPGNKQSLSSRENLLPGPEKKTKFLIFTNNALSNHHSPSLGRRGTPLRATRSLWLLLGAPGFLLPGTGDAPDSGSR